MLLECIECRQHKRQVSDNKQNNHSHMLKPNYGVIKVIMTTSPKGTHFRTRATCDIAAGAGAQVLDLVQDVLTIPPMIAIEF